jgi:hypothetical protein
MHTYLRLTRISVLAWTGLSIALPLAAQGAWTKEDRQGPVTVALTLLAPPAEGAPLRVKVVLDTHSVGLDDIALARAVTVEAPDGSRVPPAAVEEATGGGHHRQAVLVFPGVGSGPVRIVVRGVGGVPERAFSWDVIR